MNGTRLQVDASGEVTYTYDCGSGHKAVFTLDVTVEGGTPEPQKTPGDVNADGKVDGRDALRLNRYLAGQDVTIDEKASDVNADGRVDGRDALRLTRWLAGQSVELK